MLKPILLASAMMISAPAFAQDMQQQNPAATAPTQTMPATPDTTLPPSEATPQSDGMADTSPSESMTQSADQTAAPSSQPTQASPAQIAEVVDTEFPTYDKDADGEITETEFGQWMVALRSASDPATDAQSAEVRTWVDQAFASADTDQSDKVSKAELTTFLAQGAS